jgi:2,5-diamino-6-(ribosylamino)-4(3H)-pyrimidinone 5'-phosphate reductase
MKVQDSKLKPSGRQGLHHAPRNRQHTIPRALHTSGTRLPFVLVNMAMTADGKIATMNRAISLFSSKRDHSHLLELRATADAVMCGARTADLENINLDPGGPTFRRQRLNRGLAEWNLRIIVSGSGTLNPKAHIFQSMVASRRNGTIQSRASVAISRDATPNPAPIIILTTKRAGRRRLERLRAVADEVSVFGTAQLDLRAALIWLAKEWNVRRLVCEGGGELNDAMFRAGLVDEMHLTLCPRIIGGRQAPTISDGAGFHKLAHAAQLQLESVRRVGDELFLVYRSCKSRS